MDEILPRGGVGADEAGKGSERRWNRDCEGGPVRLLHRRHGRGSVPLRLAVRQGTRGRLGVDAPALPAGAVHHAIREGPERGERRGHASGDIAVGVTLTFDNGDGAGGGDGGPPGGMSIASGVCGYIAESSEEAMYAARGGRITLHGPAHCPTSATIRRKSAGRRNGCAEDGDSEVRVEFALPSVIPEIESSGGFKMPNSIGFIYEAEAVRRLIESGQGSFPQWTPLESVACIETIEEVLSQVNGN